MVSSEMSLCNLVLITTDRTLVLALDREGFTKRQAKYAMNLTWCLVIILSLLPIVEFEYFGQEDYIKHGVCFLFNFTEGKTPGWEYAMVIFIVFNGLCLIWIITGYSFIIVRLYKLPSFDDSPEGHLARKMILVIVTDCLCWMPPMVLGIMSLMDYEINPKFAMWMSVLVFPLNSSLNPFLYTLGWGNEKSGSEEQYVDETQNDTCWETEYDQTVDYRTSDEREGEDEEAIEPDSDDNKITVRADINKETVRADVEQNEAPSSGSSSGSQEDRRKASSEMSESETKKTTCQMSRTHSIRVKGADAVETEVQISMTIEMTNIKSTASCSSTSDSKPDEPQEAKAEASTDNTTIRAQTSKL